MPLEAVNTSASIATFIVVAATAVAAIVQLRHIRRANQLSGLFRAFDLVQDPSVRDLINFVRHDLGERMKDPAFVDGLHQLPVDRREHPELYLCDIYQHIGSFVRSGLIDEDLYLQTDWYNVDLYWSLLHDTIALIRKDRPFVFENFEYLAARAKAWADAHPHGDYPAGVPRALQA